MSASGPALLFDGGTGETRKVVATWDAFGAGTLRVSDGVRTHAVAADRLELGGGGWQRDALTLAWKDGEIAFAITITDRDARDAWLAVLPPRFAGGRAALERRARQVSRRRAITYALVGAFVLAPIAALVSIYLLRDRILDAVVRRLPPTVDAQIGDALEAQLSAAGGFVESGPAAGAVRALGERLLRAAPAHPHRFRFRVRRDPTVNAFAAPGGLVVVNTGLLAAAESADEVAGVLAHELVHVLHRHSMRQLVFRAGLGASFALLLGSPDGAAGTLASAASTLTSLGFGREQERDADVTGLDLLVKARLPAEGMVTFFERLAKDGLAPPALLSSHPASAERAEALRAAIVARGAWPREALDLDWAAVKASVK